jgi:K+-transporting ATPase KdpF subunit
MNSGAVLYHQKLLKMNTRKLSHMKAKFPISFLALTVVPENTSTTAANGPLSYIIGGIIALLIMGYLVYVLLRPDKF